MLSRFAPVTKTCRSRRFAVALNQKFEVPHRPTQVVVPQPAVIKESLLSNGIRVISRDSGSQVTTINVTVSSGSRAECMKSKGSAHVLAAAVLSGSSKHSGLAIVRHLESLGGRIHAHAEREKIVFELISQGQYLEETLDLLAESVFSPPLAPHALENWKYFASPAYAALESCPVTQTKELLHEVAFGENTPLGSSFYAPSLSALTFDGVNSFRTANFVSKNIIVAGNGISHDALLQLAEKHFGGVAAGDKPVVKASPYVGGDMRFRSNLGGNSFLGLAFPVPAGQGKVHRVLLEVLRERMPSLQQAGGAVTPFVKPYTTGGIFGVVSSGATEVAVAQLEAVVRELKAVAAGANVDAAKAKLTVETKMALEGNHAAAVLATAATKGLTVAQYSQFEDVTAESVAAAAAAALKSNPSYTVLGATYGAPTFSSILKIVQ